MGDNWLSEKIKQYLFGDISDDEVRQRMYNNLLPIGYHTPIKRVRKTVKRNKPEHRWDASGKTDDVFAEYLQIPKEKRRKPVLDEYLVTNSKYVPQKSSSIKLYKTLQGLNMDTPMGQSIRDEIVSKAPQNINENIVTSTKNLIGPFGDFTIGRGFDNKGEYVSYYDSYDINPLKGRFRFSLLKSKQDDLTFGIGKPVEFYDRVYLDDYYDIPEEARGNPFITPAVVTAETKKFGGIIKAQNSAKLISKVNQSNANFVKRLLDPNRKSIPDWETKGQKIATHKMSWGEDEHGAYVFPEVQEIDGQLIDFTRPPYAPGIADYMAHKNNNIVRMSPEEADWFTKNYKQYYPSFKKGGRIHIKKKNRGKFTDYCGGKVTEECITRGKRSKNPLTRKRANFASVVRKWKHENGGLLKYQNPATTLDLPEGSVYGGELEPAVVKPTPLYGVLNTYYPVISEFPFTGHSELQIVDFGWDKPLTISKYGTDYDYSLVTNNCSDATRCAVEKIFGEKINPVLFTTPGDVQDFVAEKTGQKPVKEGVGQTSLGFNIPFATVMDLKNQNLDFYIQDYLHKAAKMKKQMKEENPNWNSASFDLSTAEVIQRYKDQKYKFQPFKNNNGGILKALDYANYITKKPAY